MRNENSLQRRLLLLKIDIFVTKRESINVNLVNFLKGKWHECVIICLFISSQLGQRVGIKCHKNIYVKLLYMNRRFPDPD